MLSKQDDLHQDDHHRTPGRWWAEGGGPCKQIPSSQPNLNKYKYTFKPMPWEAKKLPGTTNPGTVEEPPESENKYHHHHYRY